MTNPTEQLSKNRAAIFLELQEKTDVETSTPTPYIHKLLERGIRRDWIRGQRQAEQ